MTAHPDPDRSPAPAWDAEADEAALEARRERPDRRWWLVGGLLGLLATAGVVWFGLSATQDTISSQIVTFDGAEREVTVVYEVTRPPGTPLTCTIEVVDNKHASVGRVDVEVPASERETTRESATVRTTTRASNVDAPECRDAR